MKHQEQEYAKIFESYVEKNENSKWEKIGGSFSILIWNGSVIAVMVRVWVYILHANDVENQFNLSLIMISELWSNLQKIKIALPCP